VTTFDSNTSLVEAARAENAQVMATSVSAILDARENGQDLKIFCPYVSMDDFVLAGANGVTPSMCCSNPRLGSVSTTQAARVPSFSTPC
jgi:hypothetical protein